MLVNMLKRDALISFSLFLWNNERLEIINCSLHYSSEILSSWVKFT